MSYHKAGKKKASGKLVQISVQTQTTLVLWTACNAG